MDPALVFAFVGACVVMGVLTLVRRWHTGHW